MKQIILIRHAKVDTENTKSIDSLALKEWVALYDTAPLLKNSLPTENLKELAHTADVVLTSTLRRAIDSAEILGVEVFESSSLFNEAAIPEVNIPFLKLKPKSWLVILRGLLIFGFGKEDTSLKASKTQAKKAAQKLESLTEDYENVVLVGHGGMNWLISQDLLKEGWQLDDNSSNANWGVRVLRSVT